MTRITDEAVETVAGHFYTKRSGVAWSQIDPHCSMAQDYKRWAREALESLPHLEGATPPYELESERISWHRKEGYEAGLAVAHEGATPAIDREALERAIERGAVSADLAKYFQLGDMDKLVNEVMALIGGAS